MPSPGRSLVAPLLFAGACSLAASAAASPAADLTPAQLETIVRDMSAWVEKIRGLKFKTPVGMEIIDGAADRRDAEPELLAPGLAGIQLSPV